MIADLFGSGYGLDYEAEGVGKVSDLVLAATVNCYLGE
jgi:hypothetical protein